MGGGAATKGYIWGKSRNPASLRRRNTRSLGAPGGGGKVPKRENARPGVSRVFDRAGGWRGLCRGSARLGLAGLCSKCLLLGGGRLVAALAIHHRARHQAGVLADRLLDLAGDLGILLQELLGVLAALPDALTVVGKPGTRLLHHAGSRAEVD